ncbi:MAG TPA: hypothetical protein VEA37_10730 [Flavobacterium sp.]|nr:hypothetical protein [Flavobacterium sp.]
MKKKLQQLINDLDDQTNQYRKFVDRVREPGYELAPCVKENLLFAARKIDEVKNKLETIVK